MKSLIFLTVLMIALCQGVSAQVDFKTLVISPKVGDVIDKAENDTYNLFSTAYPFRSAKFLISPDKKYFVEFTYTDTNNSRMEVNPSLLILYAERIEFKDAIDDGIYKPGLSVLSVDSAGGKFFVKLKNNYFTKLPFAEKYKAPKVFHPMFGFGGGMKYLNTDLSELKGVYDYVEETVRGNGFSIDHNNLDNGPSLFWTVNFYATVSKSVGLYFEAGRGVNSSWKSYYTSILAKFYYDFKSIDWLKLYAGAGFTKLGFSGKNDYFAVISNPNAYGDYWMLDGITTDVSSYGWALSFGSEAGYFNYRNTFYVTGFLDLNYSLSPEKVYNVSYDGEELSFFKSATVKFGGLSVSTGIKIYF